MLALKIVLVAIATISGLIGAGFWWKGSTITKRGMEAFHHMKITGQGSEESFPYLERIGWWNKWAAVATAISVIAGAFANLIQ
jgi:hypothetical protein